MSTILLSGASGFIGSRLAQSFASDGHRIVPLVRGRPSSDHTVAWDPEKGSIDREALARARPDVVINLAGEPIARRWTPARRHRIRESRVRGTEALADALAGSPMKPKVFLSGSAVGYYGAHRGDETVDETSAPGPDFLAQTARDWERGTERAGSAGIRVVVLRTGLVLSRSGGVLARMLLPFRLGVGGRLGSGRQWMSWIAMDDIVAAIRFLVDTPTMNGPVNLVAPEPARNVEFTKTLAHVLRRPAVFPVPAILLELLFGTMADNTILASQRVIPKRLAGAGFQFRHPRLEDALRFALTR